MKFVIKSGSTVKLFSGDMKIEALAQFLKANFPSWNSNNLTYTDPEGDKITLTSQQDLDALVALNPHSQFIKFQVQTDNLSEEKPTQIFESEKEEEKQIVEPKVSRFEKKASRGKKSSSKSLKKPKDRSKKKDRSPRHQRKREKYSQKITSSEESAEDSSKKDQLKMIEGIINEKVAQMVDQRIKNLIPCIKNQVNQNFEVSVIKPSSAIKHEGILCNGCNMTPIAGIRYKCLECPSFNLCTNCEQNLQHQHNLLKMKKIEEASQKNTDFRTLFKAGKKLLRQMKHHHSSSESQNEKRSHRHRGWKGRQKSENQEFVDHKMNKKLFKLNAIFGERQNFKEFIAKYFDLRPYELIQVYASQNNVSAQELQEKRNQMRKSKLATFYDCPEADFEEVVKVHPKLNFREIIMKLKQTGERTYTEENFKRMRHKFKHSRNEKKSEEKVEEKNSNSKEEKGKENEKKKVMETQLRNEILNQMTELFGDEKKSEYLRFIEDNLKLGKQGIIAIWIESLAL